MKTRIQTSMHWCKDIRVSRVHPIANAIGIEITTTTDLEYEFLLFGLSLQKVEKLMRDMADDRTVVHEPDSEDEELETLLSEELEGFVGGEEKSGGGVAA